MEKFEVKQSKDEGWHFVLKARNGQVILSSQVYAGKSGALNGIQSIKENAPNAEIVFLDDDSNEEEE